MQRSVSLILGSGKMKTKPAQNTNEFNCVDSMVSLIWTPVKMSIESRESIRLGLHPKAEDSALAALSLICKKTGYSLNTGQHP
jgi:hypothetical protein